MKDLKRTKVKSTTLNLHNRINNKLFVTNTSLNCNTFGKSIQENPVLCYMFIEFCCTEKYFAKVAQLNFSSLTLFF